MRLDFNVLWVDDQPKRIEAQIAAIAREMENEGFNFSPRLCQGIDEVRPLLSGSVFSDEVDLILVDWDLGTGVKGQEVISEVRHKVRYKDVVFYSAQTAPDDLRKLAYDAGLEGVFCAARDGLIDEVIGVFESLVKKVLDLDHARGIVMGATSDIDHMVNQCLFEVHASMDVGGQRTFVAEAIALIDQRMASLSEKLVELKADGSGTTLLAAHFLFTANDRLRMLARALERKLVDGHAGARKAVTDYMSKVVPERNF
jgi:hypothetical protein